MKTTVINSKGQVENGNTDNGKPKATKATDTPNAKKETIKFEGMEKEAPTKATTAEQKATATDQQDKKASFSPNLEQTLQLVDDLHRKRVQRDRLLTTIKNLDSFEVNVKDGADETDSNFYHGCKITIKDDNNNEFVTRNPVIIQAVALHIKEMCKDRLAEIEANIVLPSF